jgi:hypothetical protein
VLGTLHRYDLQAGTRIPACEIAEVEPAFVKLNGEDVNP